MYIYIHDSIYISKIWEDIYRKEIYIIAVNRDQQYQLMLCI